jgi:hypothetical protein
LLHIAFRLSSIDLIHLIKTCPRLQAVQLPPSYTKTLSKASRSILDMQGVNLIEGDVWGHRKDIDEYYVIDESIVEEIGHLMSGDKNIDEVVSSIKNKTKMSSELIKYIAKQKMVI